MNTAGEICVLVKFSPKRESILGEIKDNIDVEVVDENELHAQASIPSLDKLCVTHWTVRV